jgi:hypothetical protein
MQKNPQQQQQQYQSLQLDQSHTLLALQKAREAREMGTATLERLSEQARPYPPPSFFPFPFSFFFFSRSSSLFY